MMKKTKTKLIILGTAIAVLGVTVGLLLYTRPDSDEPQKSGTELVSVGDADDITIRISNAEGEYYIRSDKNGCSLAGLPEEEAVEDDLLEAAVRNLSQISGNKVDNGNMERYGLEQPAAEAELDTGDEKVTLLLGSYNESTGTWYMQKKGDESIYSIPSGKGDWLMNSPFYYLDKTLIASYDRQSESLTDRLQKITIDRPDLEEPIVIEATDETPAAYTSAYEIVSPIRVKTSYKVMNENIGALLGLKADAVEGAYDPTEAGTYGMDKPAMALTVVHDGMEETFTVGAEKEDGVHYLVSDQRDLLYSISDVKLSFLNVTVDDLFFGLALVPDINSVQEVRISQADEIYDFRIQSDAENEITGITMGAREIDEKLFREFYSLLIAVDVQELSGEEPEGSPVLQITYCYKDGSEDRIDAYASGSRDMLLALNGKVQYKGRIAFLDKLSAELQHLLAGEAIDTDW